ncbi:MAG: TVP38/TMEM64 family protein [Rubrobacteraceae bacterium]|nr:TVP38/TMEM64 family protein [Rubrobacter sp.]
MSLGTRSLRAAAARSALVRGSGRRLWALLFWLALLGGYQSYAWWKGISPLEAAQGMVDSMGTGATGALIFVAFYVVSRLVLFPATLLTIVAGYVFGPVLGVVLTMLGSNAAASVSYLMGHYFGEGLLGPGEKPGVARRYAQRMRDNGFETVLLMCLLYAPLDLVGMLAGFLRIRWKSFALAIALGLIPATLSWVLFGASIETDLTGGEPRIKPSMLFASLVLLAGSLSMSRYLRRRNRVAREGPLPSEEDS